MMPATICKEIPIQAPATHVWQLIGTAAGLRQWWKADVTLEAKAGGRCVERGFFNGAPYQVEGIVATYDPPRRLELLLAGDHPGAEGPITMHIILTLTEVAGVTTVRAVQQLAPLVAAVTQTTPVPLHPASPPSGAHRPLPTILNQRPGRSPSQQAMGMPAARRSDADQAVVDAQVYEVWWTGRLHTLLQLTQKKEKAA